MTKEARQIRAKGGDRLICKFASAVGGKDINHLDDAFQFLASQELQLAADQVAEVTGQRFEADEISTTNQKGSSAYIDTLVSRIDATSRFLRKLRKSGCAMETHEKFAVGDIVEILRVFHLATEKPSDEKLEAIAREFVEGLRPTRSTQATPAPAQ